MKNWQTFNEKYKDILDFPIKKYTYIIKEKIENNIKEGINKYVFDFLNEITLPIKFNLIINYIKENQNKYKGEVNQENVIKNFDNFDLNVLIISNKIDYNQVYSVINHELKHVYDLYYDVNIESFESLNGYYFLKEKYKKHNILIDFVELSNLALKHELDARLSMIYDKLRWLKTFDKSELEEEFKKTYVFKSLNMLNDFDSDKILNMNFYILQQFTNDFNKYFIKNNKNFNDINDLKIFYKNAETSFKKIYTEYLKKCYDVIDELIIDNRPYMENKIFSTDPYFNKISVDYLYSILKQIF